MPLPSELIKSGLVILAICPLLTFMQKRVGLYSSLACILALIAAKLSFDMGDIQLQSNYYDTLEVGRHSSVLEIRQAYKKVSRKSHPDKNRQSKDVDLSVFHEVQTSYDVLMDEKNRDVYNRFGKDSVGSDPRTDELKLISDIMAGYLFWALVTYVATVTQSTKMCRTWITLMLLVIMVVEVSFSLTESCLPSWMPSQLTEYKLIAYMHSAFPGLILLCRCVAEHLFVDYNQVTAEVLTSVSQNQESLRDLLQHLERLVADKSNDQQLTQSLVLVKVSEIRNDMVSVDERASRALDTLKKASSNPLSSYYWLVFVVIYGGVYFFQE